MLWYTFRHHIEGNLIRSRIAGHFDGFRQAGTIGDNNMRITFGRFFYVAVKQQRFLFRVNRQNAAADLHIHPVVIRNLENITGRMA